MKKVFGFLLLFFVLSVVGGCSNDDSGSKNSIEITSDGFYIENIDTGFWSSNPPSATMFLTLFINYPANLDENDISVVEASSPDEYVWKLYPDDLYIDTDYRYIKLSRLWNDYDSARVNLGEWKVTLTLKDGSTGSCTIVVGEPNSATGPVSEYATSEMPGTNDVAAISVPSINSAVYDSSSDKLTITFTVNDSRVRNGFIWFYDDFDEYVGNTDFFKNENGVLSSIFTSFKTDGTLNTATIALNDFDEKTISSLAEVKSFCIIVTDGAQYPDKYTYYDYRSITGNYSDILQE